MRSGGRSLGRSSSVTPEMPSSARPDSTFAVAEAPICSVTAVAGKMGALDGGNTNFGSEGVFDGWENENGDDVNEELEGTEGVIVGLATETPLDGVEGCAALSLFMKFRRKCRSRAPL